MLKPRKHSDWITKPRLKFLGGVAEFDLWWRDDLAARMQGVNIPEPDILPYLRVVTISSSAIQDWDEFLIPLHLNREMHSNMEPAMRRLRGRWGDVTLTLAQVAEIRTYLQCFAPWVLGEGLADVST